MKKIDKVLSKVVPGGSETSAVSPAAAGSGKRARAAGHDHIDAINQLFAELELAYHNQFHKAYGQEGALSLAKKYWLEVLQEFPPAVILRAVRQVVRGSEFLPSLAAIVSACEDSHALFGLPSARAAYVEACCAAEPKAAQRWSHPAVFHAGEATGWFTLASETEAAAFPRFEYNYTQLCRRVVRGEQLDHPLPVALPERTEAPLDPKENLERLRSLRRKFDL